MRQAQTHDRRTERTRTAVLAGFSELIFTIGYDRMTVRDVIERARVGRSTFYEHFEDKEDVLRQSVGPVLAVLAATLADGPPPAQLEPVIAHFNSGGPQLRASFEGSPRRLLSTFLAAHIEQRLVPARDIAPAIPPAMIAMQIAQAQLGLIESWLDDPRRCSAGTVAAALTSSSRAAAAVLLRPPAQRTCETSIARAAPAAAANAARR